jgi:hypothetical protein
MKLAQIRARGMVNVLELREIFLEIVDHDEWQAGFDMLCDYSQIENFDVSSQDIDEITEWQTTIDDQIGDGRCAVVASKDAVFGMSRMWEMLSSERSQHIYVFRQINDAVSWLGDPVKTGNNL